MPQEIYIALGANLPSKYGTPKETLSKSIEFMGIRGLEIVSESSFHKTPAWPVGTDQPDYLNAVIEIDSNLDAEALIELLHQIELDMGRTRHKRWESRVIDLDLLAYGQTLIGWPPPIEEGEIKNIPLCVPHARMHERLFVLKPLSEIAPHWNHPYGLGSVKSLIKTAENKSP